MIAETYLAQCFLAVALQHGSRLERRRHESREGLWRIALRHLQVMSVGCKCVQKTEFMTGCSIRIRD
jgi:hypothetical protein